MFWITLSKATKKKYRWHNEAALIVIQNYFSDFLFNLIFFVLVGLILVAEPYYNEAGYEKQRGTQQGVENSRMYNEMAIVKVVQVSLI